MMGCGDWALTITQHRPMNSPEQKPGQRRLQRSLVGSHLSLLCSSEQGIAQRHAKLPSVPKTLPLQPPLPKMLPNPFWSSGASSGWGAGGLAQVRQPLPWAQGSMLRHPLFSSPLLLLSLPKARPLGLPARGGRRAWTSCQA